MDNNNKSKNGELDFDNFLSNLGDPLSKPQVKIEKKPVIESNKISFSKDDKEILLKTTTTEQKPLYDFYDIPGLSKTKDPSITLLFKEMLKINASDLHISIGRPPIFRINGELTTSELPEITKEKAENLLFPILLPEHMECYEENGEVDFAFEETGILRVRANYYKDSNGIAASFRCIPLKIPTIEELGMPQKIVKLTQFTEGLVLITGPTGSGKSSTLAAIINYINKNKKLNILTIEDPIEFVHPSINSLITQRELGLHTTSFAEALRSSLRGDFDIVLVGEMRDLETTAQALKLAETGSLVFSTMHTNSAAKTIDRIIDIFPLDAQEHIRTMLGDTIKAIFSQRLLLRTDEKGRVAATELLFSTQGLSNIIRDGKTPYINTVIQTGKELGMHSMDQSIVELIKKGMITSEEGKKYANDHKIYERAGIFFEVDQV